MPADSEPLAVITIIASFFLDSDCRHYALWTAPGPEIIRVSTYLASWPFSHGCLAVVEQSSTCCFAAGKIGTDERERTAQGTHTATLPPPSRSCRTQARPNVKQNGIRRSSPGFRTVQPIPLCAGGTVLVSYSGQYARRACAAPPNPRQRRRRICTRCTARSVARVDHGLLDAPGSR